MAKIDELNFQLILDDKKFNQQISIDIESAKNLNLKISDYLNLKKKVTHLSAEEFASLKRIENLEHRRKMNAEDEARAASRKRQELAKEEEIVRRNNRRHSETNRLMREAAGLAASYFSIAGAEKLIKNLVRVSSEFELQRTTLRAIMQDLNGADKIFDQIKSLAVVSPFSFKELVTYTKQLSAYSIPMNELYETTKMLADVSAGLGVGMDRLVLAYGQVRSAAFLRGQEVRQFTEAGIPILDELAKQFSEIEGRLVSVGEVFDKISARQVPFEMVAKVFKEMTSEGGKFYQMQEIQSETLRGKISNLTDAYEIMFSEIGEKLDPDMKSVVDWARSLAENYEKIGRDIVELVAAYGIYRTLLVAITLASKGYTLAQVAQKVATIALEKAQKLLNATILKNPYALLAAGITAVLATIYKLIQGLTQASEIQQHFNKTIKEMEKNEASEVALLDTLYARLKLATKGTKEYDAARSAIMTKYDKYIKELEQEGVAVNNLADIYAGLKDKIIEANKERYLNSALADAEKDFGDFTAKLMGQFKDKFRKDFWHRTSKENANATEEQKEALWQWITGVISKQEALKHGVTHNMIGSNAWMKRQFEDAKKEYLEIVKMAEQARRAFTSNSGESRELPIFVELVQRLLGGDKEANKFKGIWADEFTQYSEYLDVLRKRYAELDNQINLAGNTQSAFVEGYKEEARVIRTIARALDLPDNTNIFDYVTGVKKEKSSSSREKTPEQIELERQIELIKRLKEAYEDLTPYVSDDKMARVLGGLFSNSITDADKSLVDALHYEEQLIELAKRLAQYDEEASARVLLSLGVEDARDLTSAYKDAFDRMKAYSDFITEWQAKDFGTEGSGIMFDLSKIASDLNNKFAEINKKGDKARDLLQKAQKGDNEALNALKETYGEEFWKDFVTNGEDAIRQLVSKEKEVARTVSQERVNDLASRYVKEEYFNENIDFDHLGSKSFYQLHALRKKLQAIIDEQPLTVSVDVQTKLAANGIDIKNLYATDENGNVITDVNLDAAFDRLKEAGVELDETTEKTLRLMYATQKAGISFDKMTKRIQTIVGGGMAKVTEEEGRALLALILSWANEFKQAMESIAEYAEVSGNEALGSIARGFSEIMDFINPVVDKLTKGDWIGAIISGVTVLATRIMEALTAQERFAQAIADAARQQSILNSQMAIAQGVESVWGKDSYKEFVNAYDEATKAYEKAAKDRDDAMKKLSGGKGNDTNGAATVIGAAAGAGLGAAIGVWFFGVGALIGAAIGAGVGAVAGAIIDITGEIDNYTLSLQEMADSIGADLLNKYDTYNLETLKKILEVYDDLDKESKEYIENLIANAEILNNAIEAVAETLSDLLDNVADSVADSFINAFKESGKAALDYADILDNVATSIVKMVMKSALLQTIFDDDKAKMVAAKLIGGDMAGAMEVIEQSMKEAEALAPTFQEWLEAMQQYFVMGTTGSNNLAEGIQALTESTGDLLASYLNAIRADVSYAKVQRDSIIGQIGKILSLMPQSPRLADYLAQIQANTFNTAMATEDILSELRGVITTDGGMAAVRAYM